MKKSILTISLSIFSLYIQAQQIPNGGFETWKTTSFEPIFPIKYEDPENWQTLNVFVGGNAKKPIEKSTDKVSGSFSLLAQNVTFENTTFLDTASGFAATKFKVSQFPQFFNFYYKCDLKGAKDSVSIAAIATKYDPNTKKSDGVGFAGMNFVTSQSTYKFVSIPFFGTPGATPDTITILLSSSGSVKKNKTPGTSLWLDDLSIDYGPLGLIENYSENQVKVYPSPATDNFYITGLSDNSKSYRLLNTQGLVVKTGTIINPELTEVNIQNQNAGLYFIETFDMAQVRVSRHKVSIK